MAAAITEDPKLLIEDWIVRFAMENMIFCRPAGIPTFRILNRVAPCRRRSRPVIVYSGSMLFRRRSVSSADIAWEITVASPTPKVSMPKATTKITFRIRLTMPDIVR